MFYLRQQHLKNRERGIDFFPLSVEYNERLYSVRKVPGGFNKREGRSQNAVLTCRVIDRPSVRFSQSDYRNDVTLENLCYVPWIRTAVRN